MRTKYRKSYKVFKGAVNILNVTFNLTANRASELLRAAEQPEEPRFKSERNSTESPLYCRFAERFLCSGFGYCDSLKINGLLKAVSNLKRLLCSGRCVLSNGASLFVERRCSSELSAVAGKICSRTPGTLITPATIITIQFREAEKAGIEFVQAARRRRWLAPQPPSESGNVSKLNSNIFLRSHKSRWELGQNSLNFKKQRPCQLQFFDKKRELTKNFRVKTFDWKELFINAHFESELKSFLRERKSSLKDAAVR